MAYPPHPHPPESDPYSGQPPQPTYPAPYGPGSSHRPQDEKTNGLAVASLITGIIGCISIAALVLGLIALKQIKERGGKGRGLAITGIALFCAWSVLSVAAVALSDGSDSPSSGPAKPTPTKTKSETINVTKMRVGQCINDNTPASEDRVENIQVVPCTKPHDGEVLAVFKLGGILYPGDEKARKRARAGCRKRTADRIARDPKADKLARTNYWPDAESWRGGDHSVTCLVAHIKDGKKLKRPLRP